jgi:hypothetical protein
VKYNEIKVKCYGTAESGPFIELENGKRVYGLAAAAPELLEALRDMIELCESYRAGHNSAIADRARAAIAKATGQN